MTSEKRLEVCKGVIHVAIWGNRKQKKHKEPEVGMDLAYQCGCKEARVARVR